MIFHSTPIFHHWSDAATSRTVCTKQPATQFIQGPSALLSLSPNGSKFKSTRLTIQIDDSLLGEKQLSSQRWSKWPSAADGVASWWPLPKENHNESSFNSALWVPLQPANLIWLLKKKKKINSTVSSPSVAKGSKISDDLWKLAAGWWKPYLHHHHHASNNLLTPHEWVDALKALKVALCLSSQITCHQILLFYGRLFMGLQWTVLSLAGGVSGGES